MPEQKQQRLVMLHSTTGDNCRTFVFKNEGHTLGNALRSVILQNPQVLFCGYSMPHPAEDQMFLRIQTAEGVDAQDILKKGLEDLKSICHHTKEVFQASAGEA
jgi:DNA-directed RNA polymerase I and III subunit RPAC2